MIKYIEHIKATMPIMINIYENLFDLILDTGFIPSSWTTGIIKPVYKNKSNKNEPQTNHTGELLFTSILNNRLNTYANENDILKPNHVGFRKGFSTADNIFIMHALIHIINGCKRKVYCAFVDFKSAFDTVWTAGLWRNIIDSNIDRKVFKVIKNMYTNIKSCVSLNDNSSNFFVSNMGVKQGENLSPFLFLIFMNDLEDYLRLNGVPGIRCETQDEEEQVVTYFKLFTIIRR